MKLSFNMTAPFNNLGLVQVFHTPTCTSLAGRWHQPHQLTPLAILTRNTSSMATSKAPLVKRSVVSSFLYKFTEEDGQVKPKIALFKRSGKVRTYP